MQTPSFLWITDPWSTLHHSKDTTLRLMHEALNMGIPTFWTASDFIFSAPNPGEIMAVKVPAISDLAQLDQITPHAIPLSSFHQIHVRTDPPVDDAYRSLIDRLITNGAQDGVILNPPELLKHQSEKIPHTALMRYAPKMMVVRLPEDIDVLMPLFKTDSEIVSKPLHLAQSIGVAKHITPESRNGWHRLLDSLTEGFTQPILIQEFLPGIHHGETRLWFAGDTLVGALKKYPKKGDFRVLIDEGSTINAHQLNASELAIAEAIGKTNQSLGILMAAVDLIDDKICDYNITSPGLLIQLEEVNDGKNLARIVLDRALEYRAPVARE